MLLQDRVAVVTGSGRGLGLAYARALAAAGAAVVVNDVDGDAAHEAVAAIVGAGGRAVPVVAPVGPAETARQLVDAAMTSFGRLDAMVTNAGVLRDRTIAKMTDDDFDLVIDTHLRGTFTCARAAIEVFRDQGPGGRLILVGSPAGQRASFGQANYSAAKSGIVGMGRTLAAECAKIGATVNTIVPVAVTRMLATIPGMAELVETVEAGGEVPAARRRGGLGTVDDVAALVVYLASPAADEVTGQCIGVGGDRLALYSHPTEVATANREGGWTPEAIADVFPGTFGGQLQPFQPSRKRPPAEGKDAR